MAKPAAPSIDQVYAKAAEAAFAKPLVNNSFRGHLAEAIVALALEPEWRWCGADWASWDFEDGAGTRLEVKQTSVRQSWEAKPGSIAKPRFDIRERKGRWEGAIWVAEVGRMAHIYIFAAHSLPGDEADHRDVEQWKFYVVDANELPQQSTIGLTVLETFARPVPYSRLLQEVASVRRAIALKTR